MSLFLLRFWPVLLPLLVYLWWLQVVRRKAIKAGLPPLAFRDGPWFWVVVASLVVGVTLLMVMGLSNKRLTGNYIPPYVNNGKIIEGHVEP